MDGLSSAASNAAATDCTASVGLPRAAVPSLRVAVGIPTVGRAAILRETLRELAHQTHVPHEVIVCGAKPEDLQGAPECCAGLRVLLSEPGLPRQRNAIIGAAGGADILLFLDDDFLPDPGYIATLAAFMAADPNIVVATGSVIADGIGGPGLTPAQGREMIGREQRHGMADSSVSVRPVFSGYGCNMAVRMAPVLTHDFRFDERLPLYGWQEDVDFSRRLAAFGAVVQLSGARGVHLGVKSGRASGVRLGYSQVANPLYLAGKRAGYPLLRALVHVGRNIAMNVARAPRPEIYVDRRGRLRGNIVALADLLLGRMRPERILEL